MARFIGFMRGNRGETSSLGSTRSGLQTIAASEGGAVHVRLYVDSDGNDRFIVELHPWQGSDTRYEIITEGRFLDYKPLPKDKADEHE